MLGNTLRTDYVYNPWTTQNGRLQQIKTGTTANPTSLQDLRYTYDAVGNVLTIQDYKAGNPQAQTFHYDSLDRLKDAQATGGTNGNGDYGTDYYTYDQIGNLHSKTGLGTYSYATNCSGGTSHALAHAVASTTGGYSYAYDCNGNMTTRVEISNSQHITYTQAWDAENRLRSVVNLPTGEVTEFAYDGDPTPLCYGDYAAANVK